MTGTVCRIYCATLAVEGSMKSKEYDEIYTCHGVQLHSGLRYLVVC